jgi:hypothetical protein
MTSSKRSAGDPLFKQSVEFSAAMLTLVRLSRRSEPPPGRSKPRLEWEKQIAAAKKKAVKALLKDQPGGIDEALLTRLLVFGQHAVRVGMYYEESGITRLLHPHPVGLVAHFLRDVKR